MVVLATEAPGVVLDSREYRTEFARFLIHRRHVSRSTADDYERDLQRVERYTGIPRDRFTASVVEIFLESDAYSHATKNRGLTAVRTCHKWGARKGYWKLDVDILDLKMPRRQKISKRPLTLIQARTLLAHSWRSRDVRLSYSGLYAGLRPFEMAALDEPDWVIGIGGIEVLEVVGKFGKLRRIPVHPELSKMRDRILIERVSKRQLQRRVGTLRNLVEREDFTLHMLRRTFGRALSEAGVERDVISELLGHAMSGVTAEHYVPPRWDECVEAILRLDYGPGQMRLW